MKRELFWRKVVPQLLTHIPPTPMAAFYLIGHINRFGDYRIDPERKPDPLRHRLKLKPISDTIRD